MSRNTWMAVALAVVAALTCGVPAPADAASPNHESRPCNTCGVVESVRFVEKEGEASGLGAVAGGVLGGVLGHQVGSGRGNTVATIAGAGAGAYAGHRVEKNTKKKSYYSVAVRLDNGEHRSFTMGSRPAFHDGDRVKVVDGKRLALLAP